MDHREHLENCKCGSTHTPILGIVVKELGGQPHHTLRCGRCGYTSQAKDTIEHAEMQWNREANASDIL